MADYTRDVNFDDEVIVGDTLELEFEIVDKDEAPFDLTGCTIWFTIKENHTDSDAAAIVQNSTAVHDDAINGGSSMKTLIPADAALGKKYYDCQVTDAAGGKFTFKRGRLKLDYEVTKS